MELQNGGMEMINGGNLYRSDRVSDEYLLVNNCGYQATGSVDTTTVRPRGRSDYLLLYVWHGRLVLREGGEEISAPVGSLVLYRPRESQHYRHVAAERTEVYWLHFTGSGVSELLKRAGIDARVTSVGCVPEVREQYSLMIRELQLRQRPYEMVCTAHAMTLISAFARQRLLLRENAEDSHRSRRLSGVIEQMHLHCGEPLSVSDLAMQCGLSEYHFIHLFREYTGFSPHAYVTRLRLDKAKDLMVSTTMNISEIAFAVGYANPLYFSRLFKRHTGLSPSRFRTGAGGEREEML